MKRHGKAGLYWGVGLFLVGLFFTFFTFGRLRSYQNEVTWVTIGGLGLAGLAVLAYSLLRPERWWSFIPAFLLLGMAGVVYFGVMRQAPGIWQAAIIFLSLALAHLIIFLTSIEERWWAWVSAGTFFLFTGILIAGHHLSATMIVLMLLLGLALIFYVLYLVMPHKRQRWWSLTLATALAIVGGFTFSAAPETSSSWANYWPLLLILLGIALLVRYLVQVLTAAERQEAALRPGVPSPSSQEASVSPAAAASAEGVVDAVSDVSESYAASREAEEASTDEGSSLGGQ